MIWQKEVGGVNGTIFDCYVFLRQIKDKKKNKTKGYPNVKWTSMLVGELYSEPPGWKLGILTH